MKLEIKDIVEGACNFCEKGVLRSDLSGMDYPYTEVLHLSGNSSVVRFCEDCYGELQNKKIETQTSSPCDEKEKSK